MRHPRADLSPRLTHLIRKDKDKEPADVLYQIAIDKCLKGSSRAIFSQANVVCFTEAPKSQFAKESRYFSSFGISVDKSWLFSIGGRPVIYQPREDDKYIDKSLYWKIVHYSPDKTKEEGWTDWTWQREWRIKTDGLYLPPEKTIFYVPSEDEKQKLLARYQENEENNALMEALVLYIYFNSPREFPYQIEVISIA